MGAVFLLRHAGAADPLPGRSSRRFSLEPAVRQPVYGWYTGLVWFTPILGGYLADRFLGTHKSLVIGASVISLGHFALAFERQSLFFLGLILIVLGTGFFKSNVSTMVGQLYQEDDPAP